MIASIEPVYREQTAQAFKFALEAERPLSLMTYSFLDEEDLDDVVTAPFDPLTSQEILSRQDDMRRRLNGRCKGLLEVVSVKFTGFGQENLYVKQFQALGVGFHHRTVRDFLRTKDMQNMLLEHIGPNFEPKSRICKASLKGLKAINYSALGGSDWLPYRLLNELTYYARRLEDENHVSQSSLIDEVGRFLLGQADLLDWKRGHVDFLEFIVGRRLHLYMAETLTTTKSLTQPDKNSLLGAFLDRLSVRLEVFASWSGLEMVDTLLMNGAQPNDRYKNSTVWGTFLEVLLARPSLSNVDGVLRIIESLLSYGANLQQHIIIGQTTQVREKSGKRTNSRNNQTFQSDIFKSAEQILLELFGEEKTSELVEKVRKDQTGLPSGSKWWSGRSLRASMKALKR